MLHITRMPLAASLPTANLALRAVLSSRSGIPLRAVVNAVDITSSLCSCSARRSDWSTAAVVQHVGNLNSVSALTRRAHKPGISIRECNTQGERVGYLTHRDTRCIVLPLPRPAAVDLVATAMVVGVATTPMRLQTLFPHLSLIVGVRVSDKNGGGVGDDPVSRVDDGVGRGVGDDTGSWVGGGARAVVGEGVCVGTTSDTCCSVSGHTCGESTTASIGSVQGLGPPPESGVAGRDKRLSLSRVVPAVTLKVAGRAVTYQEVVLVSSLSFVCGSPSKTCCCCAGDEYDGGVSGGGGCAGPSPSTDGVWCNVTFSVVPSSVAGDEASEGPLAGGKAPSGDEVDAAAIPSP